MLIYFNCFFTLSFTCALYLYHKVFIFMIVPYLCQILWLLYNLSALLRIDY